MSQPAFVLLLNSSLLYVFVYTTMSKTWQVKSFKQSPPILLASNFFPHVHGWTSYYSGEQLQRSRTSFLPTARGAYSALSSILLNIVNSIINAVLHHEARMRWVVSSVIDPEGKIKPFFGTVLTAVDRKIIVKSSMYEAGVKWMQ